MKVEDKLKSLLIHIWSKKWILVCLIALVLVHISVSDYIEGDKLHPVEYRPLEISLRQGYANSSCFQIDSPYIYYDSSDQNLRISTYFGKYCDFPQSITLIEVRTFDNLDIKNQKNLSMNTTINASNDEIKIIINSSDMELYESYPIVFNFEVEDYFYDNFIIYTYTGVKNVRDFSFRFDTGLTGYRCGQNCLTTIEGNVKNEEPLIGGNSKKIRFENSPKIYLRWSPISKRWFYLQKFLDSVVLGLIVILLYELFQKKEKVK